MGIELKWIVSFIVLMVFVLAIIIMILKWTLVSSTQGAVNHLNEEITNANTTQAEIAKKIREANEQLEKVRGEAKEIAAKMHQSAEEDSKAEREKIITQARKEAEDIIEKAKKSQDRIREEIADQEKQKVVDYSIRILNDILGDQSKVALNQTLVEEYLDKLNDVDMSSIGHDIKSVELITAYEIDTSMKEQFSKIIQSKAGRSMELIAKVDASIGGGVLLKFGSISLDGSVKQLILEEGNKIKEEFAV